MLLILLPIAWLALLTLFAALCRAAADGDAAMASLEHRRPTRLGQRIVLAPAAAAPPLRARGQHDPDRQRLRRANRSRRSPHGVR